MSPATGRASSALMPRSCTATMPPPISPSRRAARTMSSSSTPATTTLWASWATVEAIAPRRTPRPWMNPSPTRPVPRWRSMTAILARSRSGSANAAPPATRGGDGGAHHRVDVSLRDDVVGVAVVGAERQPARPELGHERDQRLQVAGARSLADQHPHARAQPLATLLDRGRLVVGADPGGGV